jgi:hypothetical protein
MARAKSNEERKKVPITSILASKTTILVVKTAISGIVI